MRGSVSYPACHQPVENLVYRKESSVHRCKVVHSLDPTTDVTYGQPRPSVESAWTNMWPLNWDDTRSSTIHRAYYHHYQIQLINEEAVHTERTHS